MSEGFKTVYTGGIGEIEEKKSRFIAAVAPVQNEEEAAAFLEKIRKKHWNARHNCYACVIGPNNEVTKSSDDGEPSGTAGHPMLDILLGEGLRNTMVVVTRYFGGTLLGTGGLVRAYSAAVREGLKNSVIIEKRSGSRVEIRTDYTSSGKLEYLFRQSGVPVLQTEYTDCVAYTVILTPEKEAAVLEKTAGLTSGSARIGKKEPVLFAEIDQKIICF